VGEEAGDDVADEHAAEPEQDVLDAVKRSPQDEQRDADRG
jgi:hypothetical protein